MHGILRARVDPPEARPAARGSFFLVALLASAIGACAREERRPPNFVLVLADDLGWADAGYQGSTFYRTPHIDALARDGLAFSQAYAAAPVCSPSRAAILTGWSPARLHITTVLGPNAPFEELGERLDEATPGRLVPPTIRSRLPEGIPTLASSLKELGYRTALVGKWHLVPAPRAVGFDEQPGALPIGATGSHFSPYGLATLRDGPEGEYLTDRLTDEAVRFLEENRARPFLLVLSHYAVHTPLEAPEELVAEYRARAVPGAAQRNPTYAAMVERLDDSVGRVRAALERLGLAERTLLVFTSDNGGVEGTNPKHWDEPVTSNLPLRSEKGRVYEGGLRVPMIAWGGVVARRGTCAAPVVGTDLCPTLLALAGHAPLAPSDGADLTPLLRGSGSLAREELAFHFPHESFGSALRAGDEKLVYLWKRQKSELYDLADDPGESRDLAAERPERATELERRLFAWLDAVGAERPVRAAREER
jgi:arylsulfatase A-like enzyme